MATATQQSARLVGVYNANGGLAGELAYVFGKLRGTAHCALCDISHGKHVRPKQDWIEMVRRLPLPLDAVHLNEMDAPTAALVSADNAPAIVYLDGSDDRILLDSAALEACDHSPKSLSDAIAAALAK